MLAENVETSNCQYLRHTIRQTIKFIIILWNFEGIKRGRRVGGMYEILIMHQMHFSGFFLFDRKKIL